MATIIPIQGLRYTLKAGQLGDLVTPPYDLVDEEAQERYYQRSPYNVIRLEYGKVYSTDTEYNNRYTRAAFDFNTWQKEGILKPEETPAIYLYEQIFTFNGQVKKRRGFICGLRLEPYSKGIVLPHEETLPKHKADRLALLKACQANFSPIFGLYIDEERTVDKLLDLAIRKNNLENEQNYRPPDVTFTDENGQDHNLWIITDPEIIKQLQQAMTDKRVFIADGHHRYETALNYRNERGKQEINLQGDPLYNYVMVTLVNLFDPGLVILPTHRLIRNVRHLNMEAFLDKTREYFTIEEFPLMEDRQNFPEFLELLARRGTCCCHENVQNQVHRNHHNSFGVYCGQLYLLTLRNKSILPAIMPSGRSPSWQNLDVSILHHLILDKLLGIGSEQWTEERHLTYTREEEGALVAVDSGEYQLAFFLNPTLVEEVIAIASNNEKMPQKSTFFYPKLITGLVINKLS